jgi:2',3'-cyclic-nucleotide 2'-phosphodiesterase (5'-nucleotidase family)/Ca2+-binding EF-hand superfamily protein
MTEKERFLWLRIIQVNDVYELDNFPSFKTLVDEHKSQADATLVVMAGDFLGPSLLSSLDKGRGMVDVMNHCGFTHASIGNHEADVPSDAIPQRIAQSSFCWINTNMRDLDENLGAITSPYDVVVVSNDSDAGDHFTKRVGLLGLLTDDPGLYRPDAFGGASIQPILEATDFCLKSELPQDLDLVIPLTHQRIVEDRDFANKYGGQVFPIIIGGHDHEIYDEVHNDSRIVKTGHDAIHTAIIDVKWAIREDRTVAEQPVIDVAMIPTNSYKQCPEIASIVEGHERVLQELERAKIFRFQDWSLDKTSSPEPFSTENNRLGNTTGSTILCTLLRMAMRSSLAITNAGSIRGNKTYPLEQEWFTWSDLKAELAFSTNMVALELPGKVIEDMITESRAGIRCDPPVARGGYLHHCDKVNYDNESCKILTIAGMAFDPNALYLTTLPAQFFEGIDNHVPLLEWAEQNNVHVDDECGKPAKVAMIEMFAALMWLDMGSFADIDRDGDGVLTHEEVKVRAAQVFGDDIADLVMESVMGVADLSRDGTITPIEMMVARFVATDMLDHVATHEELHTMSLVASEVLGKRASHEDLKRVVQELLNALDMDGTGTISREEAMKVLGAIKKQNLLV